MIAPQILTWCGLTTALVYLPLTAAAPSWPRSVVKTLPLVAFALAAVASGGVVWLVLGLAFSALGDLALSRKGEAAFLTGLTAFAAAHVAYIVLFVGQSAAPLWASFAAKPPFAFALVVFGLCAEWWLIPFVGALRWPVRGYITVISFMGLAAMTLPFGLATLGAGLFIASDTMLAVQLFRLGEGHRLGRQLGWGVWSTYVAGQALILAGMG